MSYCHIFQISDTFIIMMWWWSERWYICFMNKYEYYMCCCVDAICDLRRVGVWRESRTHNIYHLVLMIYTSLLNISWFWSIIDILLFTKLFSLQAIPNLYPTILCSYHMYLLFLFLLFTVCFYYLYKYKIMYFMSIFIQQLYTYSITFWY